MPIFKNKDKLYVTNYRPISILPVISKVYEKAFYNRLYDYFSVNNLLSSSQFGFRSGASTEHALLKFSDDILKLFDQKKVAIVWRTWCVATRWWIKKGRWKLIINYISYSRTNVILNCRWSLKLVLDRVEVMRNSN